MSQLSFQRSSGLAVILFLAGACGADDPQAGVDAGGGAADAMHNPPNPAGRGPAPVDLGGSTDLAASGSYAILAKTGITNVTGSAITGGNLGLSPAAASFDLRYDMVVVTPWRLPMHLADAFRPGFNKVY